MRILEQVIQEETFEIEVQYCDPDECGLLDTEKISFIRRQFIAIEPPGELLPDPQGHAL